MAAPQGQGEGRQSGRGGEGATSIPICRLARLPHRRDGAVHSGRHGAPPANQDGGPRGPHHRDREPGAGEEGEGALGADRADRHRGNGNGYGGFVGRGNGAGICRGAGRPAGRSARGAAGRDQDPGVQPKSQGCRRGSPQGRHVSHLAADGREDPGIEDDGAHEDWSARPQVEGAEGPPRGGDAEEQRGVGARAGRDGRRPQGYRHQPSRHFRARRLCRR
mmetsp:Transcript_29457/g.77223  ORF Transcript_29457/g.77223 Transcript_29457/m.77223 type:complete len:220 (+) Transcript_29457:674-1333(+)